MLGFVDDCFSAVNRGINYMIFQQRTKTTTSMILKTVPRNTEPDGGTVTAIVLTLMANTYPETTHNLELG